MFKRPLAIVIALGFIFGAMIAGPAQAKTNLKGAGSSYAFKFITTCGVKSPDYSVTYSSTGSGPGRTAFANGSVDFGASDAPNSVSLTGTRTGGQYTYIPVVGGPITIMYNVAGIKSGQLRLDAATVAKIMSGKITKWNDRGIKALQTPAVAKLLPNASIRVAYRSANSGTSENFTDWMRQSAPTIWTKAKNGTIASNNPAGRMPAGAIGAPNSQALVASVISTKNAIGYADLSDTIDSKGKPRVPVALIKNPAGQYVAPTSGNAAKFLEQFYTRRNFNSATGAVVFDYKKNISGAYNLSLLTYAMADKGATTAKAQDVENLVKYMLNTCGPQFAEGLGYTPISGELKTKALELANAIRQ
jgi:phosphate transport system substrate-binding protein